ncbi:MAG: CarD family transcriptional regulator [Clostridia bacterium]|nr:CarD family transcriptional regulator [Clostridia bacterium]
MQLTKGELVIYGTSGVCRIEDIKEESFTGEARPYYILRPTADTGNSKIFVPADNETLVGSMQRLLSAEELLAAIRETPAIPSEEWPQDGRARNKRCKELLASGDRTCLISLIKTVRVGGHTPTAAEETSCLRAATMLHQEFSLVFEVTPAEMIPLILEQTEPKIKE